VFKTKVAGSRLFQHKAKLLSRCGERHSHLPKRYMLELSRVSERDKQARAAPMTSMLHEFPDTGAIGARLQLAELDYVAQSQAAMTAPAENYVRLPFSQQVSCPAKAGHPVRRGFSVFVAVSGIATAPRVSNVSANSV